MSALSVRWVFRLDKNYHYNVRKYLPNEWTEGCAFLDRNGHRRLEIHPDGTAIVLAGYAWDGCTPKFSLFDIVFGIPDGIPNETTKKPKAYYASLMHDVFYQFIDVKLPLARKDIDKIFLEILKRDSFAPQWIYYLAVRWLGWLFRLFTRWKRGYEGRRIPL